MSMSEVHIESKLYPADLLSFGKAVLGDIRPAWNSEPGFCSFGNIPAQPHLSDSVLKSSRNLQELGRSPLTSEHTHCLSWFICVILTKLCHCHRWWTWYMLSGGLVFNGHGLYEVLSCKQEENCLCRKKKSKSACRAQMCLYWWQTGSNWGE